MDNIPALTFPVKAIRKANIERIFSSAPKPVAVVALMMKERIEQNRRALINTSVTTPLSVGATIEFNVDDATVINIKSETPFDFSLFLKGQYIYLHDSSVPFFKMQESVLCYVVSLKKYDLIAHVANKKNGWRLKTLQNCGVTVRLGGIIHEEYNSICQAIDYVVSHEAIYKKLVLTKTEIKEVTTLPAFRGYFNTELSLLKDVKKPPKFTDEQVKAINALTRQSADTFVLTGPPGTGKTTVLVEAALRLIGAGGRVIFVTPYYVSADAISREFVKRGLTDKKLIFRTLENNRDSSDLCEDCMKFSQCIRFPIVLNIDGCSVVITTFNLLYKTLEANNQRPFSHIIFDDASDASEQGVWQTLYYLYHPDLRIVLCGNPYAEYFDDIVYDSTSPPTPLFRIASNSDYNTNPNLMLTLTENHRSHKAIVDILTRLCYEDNLKATETDNHNALCDWEFLPNPGFPVLFHNIYGIDKDEIKAKSTDLVIKYLTSLRRTVKDEDIHLYCNTQQKAVIRTHFDPRVNIMSHLFEARYPRVSLVSLTSQNNFDDDSDDSSSTVYIDESSDDDLDDDEEGEDEETVDCEDEKHENDKDKRRVYLFYPVFLNSVLSKTSELVVVIANAETYEQLPAWKQFIDYCRDNNSYIE